MKEPKNPSENPSERALKEPQKRLKSALKPVGRVTRRERERGSAMHRAQLHYQRAPQLQKKKSLRGP
jgi:hypothetical protein